MTSLSPMLLALLSTSAAASAAELVPHRAVYDLSLVKQTAELVDAEGRIAMELTTERCGFYSLDYRFVARFSQEQELVLTDQQTISTESVSGDSFEFSTKTFVDGVAEDEISGTAAKSDGATVVRMVQPEERRLELPLSSFPMEHTAELIEKALAGERIVQSRLFDGDDDAEKLLSSTSIISPVDAQDREATAAGVEGSEEQAFDGLEGLEAWRISESYYNSDSDPDGLPIFQTSYVLYENGVSDDLTMDFGTYAFEGSLKELDLLAPQPCP